MTKDASLGHDKNNQTNMLKLVFEHLNSRQNQLFRQMFELRHELIEEEGQDLMLEHRFVQTPTILLVLPLQRE